MRHKKQSLSGGICHYSLLSYDLAILIGLKETINFNNLLSFWYYYHFIPGIVNPLLLPASIFVVSFQKQLRFFIFLSFLKIIGFFDCVNILNPQSEPGVTGFK